mmetsp:Transcript_41949/g.64229  ORF Transcript_41949/g.64229 Transcript_41949/m.64229 type:complete len:370 (+) Transcript_41949:14-1123(+)
MFSRAITRNFTKFKQPLVRANPLFAQCLPKRNVSLLMNSYGLNEEQTMIQEMAYQFAEAEIAPHAAEWDENKHFPIETFRAAAELGFGGIYVSEDYGGCDLSRLEASLIFEALATGCPATSAYLSITNMVAAMMDKYGNDAQKAKYLEDIVSLKRLSCYMLTEPGSGSDAGAMKTTAIDKGDHFLVNGSKCFISGSGVEDNVYLLMCMTAPKEFSVLILEDGMKGLEFSANEKKMGWNCQPTRVVTFDDVKVPKENLLGERGHGFKYAMAGLDGGRINIASCSLGGAAKSLELATQYTKERKQFGKSISEFQNTQFTLAKMATKLEASRSLLRQAARMVAEGDPNGTMYSAMAKRYATDECFDVVNSAL